MSEEHRRNLDSWGNELVASQRPTGLRSLSTGLRRLAVPLVTLAIGAGATGIAVAAVSDSDVPNEVFITPPDAVMPVADTDDSATPDLDCDAYQAWGQQVYIPWWNAQIAKGVVIDTQTVDQVDFPEPPADICGK